MTALATRTSTAVPRGERPARRRRQRTILVVVCLAAILIVGALSIVFGSRIVSLDEIVRGLVEPTAGGLAEAAVAARVPRTILGLLVGAALGLSGAAMQGVTRNPLADPGILGVNAGAALAVVLGMALLGVSGFSEYVWFALAGAAAAAVFVYAVGSLGRGGATPLKLALAGAATTAALSSLTSAVLLPRVDIMNVFRFWQIGGIGGADFGEIAQVVPFLVAGAALVLAAARGLNALSLGDDVAVSLGERVQRSRLIAAAGAVLLCGAATAIAGPIAFVGLVVPHIARLLLGSDYRWILPVSIGLGAVLLLAADVIGRVLTRPGDIEVGITMALVGAPVFIAIVRRRRLREL